MAGTRHVVPLLRGAATCHARDMNTTTQYVANTEQLADRLAALKQFELVKLLAERVAAKAEELEAELVERRP